MSTFGQTPKENQQTLVERLKQRRLSMNLTQEGLAKRSGVSWGSIKRFEQTSQISLESLLKVALVLECLQDFEKIAEPGVVEVGSLSLDEVLAEIKTRKKGRIK